MNINRSDFPVLSMPLDGKPIIYFDNACQTLRPVQVIQAMNEYYEQYPACAGRSSHKLGNLATENYEKARETIAKFIGSRKEEVIFTRNTTEGINLVAHSMSFSKGDAVLTTDKEHNSNLVPWLVLEMKKGIHHKIVVSEGEFDMQRFQDAMSPDIKLVSMVHTSNLDGSTIHAKEICKIAHDFEALFMLDAAQSIPHIPIDVKKLDIDFMAFSGHKMLGPSGTGILYGKFHLLESLEPFMTGGDTVEKTTYTSYSMLKPPEKFEAGLQNYAGAIGLAAAAKYIEKIGKPEIEKHEKKLNAILTEGISGIEGLCILGPDAEKRGGITSFIVDGMHYHDIALMLDEVANIMIRSGQHCVHSWFNAHNIEGSARASFYLYNTEEEVKIFIEQLGKIARLR